MVCPEVSYVANEVGRLFKAVGPLDELTIHRCDLRSYLHSFLTLGEGVEEPVVFPLIKQLTISHPDHISNEEYVAIVKLAKSQYILGTPFERMIIRRETGSSGMVQQLRLWI